MDISGRGPNRVPTIWYLYILFRIASASSLTMHDILDISRLILKVNAPFPLRCMLGLDSVDIQMVVSSLRLHPQLGEITYWTGVACLDNDLSIGQLPLVSESLISLWYTIGLGLVSLDQGLQSGIFFDD